MEGARECDASYCDIASSPAIGFFRASGEENIAAEGKRIAG